MTLPTHILAGLIIGKVTGNFPASMAGSILIDTDHLVSYIKHGILFKPKQLTKALTDEKDPWGDQRGYLHNIFAWFVISLLAILLNFGFGITLSLAYLVHLLFDALDTSDFYPLYPSKKISTKGFIKYYSRQEIIFDLCMLVVLALLFIYA